MRFGRNNIAGRHCTCAGARVVCGCETRWIIPGTAPAAAFCSGP